MSVKGSQDLAEYRLSTYLLNKFIKMMPENINNQLGMNNSLCLIKCFNCSLKGENESYINLKIVWWLALKINRI